MMRAKSRMNSSRTFKRSRSTDQPSSFPAASPQLILGEEILHFSHPHPLSKMDLRDLFTCAGCKEYGAGKRFACQLQCDYQLHDFCGSAPQTLKSHPLHHQHPLAFHPKSAKSGISKSKCNVCAKPIKGYVFRCAVCSFQMHPSCSTLAEEIVCSAHPHTLKLVPLAATAPPSAGEPGAAFMCGDCRRRRSGRVYRCTACDYHLHAVCAKGTVTGLHGSEFKGLERPSMFGAAMGLASRVVIDFIGGLIEGLGEGVGEAFVQNIARGRCYSRSRRTED